MKPIAYFLDPKTKAQVSVTPRDAESPEDAKKRVGDQHGVDPLSMSSEPVIKRLNPVADTLVLAVDAAENGDVAGTLGLVERALGELRKETNSGGPPLPEEYTEQLKTRDARRSAYMRGGPTQPATPEVAPTTAFDKIV